MLAKYAYEDIFNFLLLIDYIELLMVKWVIFFPLKLLPCNLIKNLNQPISKMFSDI